LKNSRPPAKKSNKQHFGDVTKRKANRIGHILHKNCLLQQVIEGKIKEGDRSDRKTMKKTKVSI